jgi:hypothetical protein
MVGRVVLSRGIVGLLLSEWDERWKTNLADGCCNLKGDPADDHRR